MYYGNSGTEPRRQILPSYQELLSCRDVTIHQILPELGQLLQIARRSHVTSLFEHVGDPVEGRTDHDDVVAAEEGFLVDLARAHNSRSVTQRGATHFVDDAG